MLATVLASASFDRAAVAERPGSYGVSGVVSPDILNIRARPDAKAPVVGTIPADARGVRSTGRQRRVGSSSWRQVTYGGVEGWVNGHFLRREAAAPAAAGPIASPGGAAPPADDLVCFVNEPLWKIEVGKNGSASCSETCNGPSGLRVKASGPASAKDRRIRLEEPSGALFMSIEIRRTDQCAEQMSRNLYAYEIVAQRPGGRAYRGCCNPLPVAQ